MGKVKMLSFVTIAPSNGFGSILTKPAVNEETRQCRPADAYQAAVKVTALTDTGMRRRNNQDSLAFHLADGKSQWERVGHLFVVADGMGAHAAGELASRLAVDLVLHHYEKNQQPRPVDNLHRSLLEANNEIFRRGQANLDFRNMGTTCSALVFVPEGAIVAHVGDSRVYHLRDNQLLQLTFDHSLIWEMQAASGLNQDLMTNSTIPKNVITRSLGPNLSVAVDLEGPFPIRKGDRFLICSDGLTGQFADEELGVLLQVLPSDQAARVMLDIANLRGGPDNISLIIVEVIDDLIETREESTAIQRVSPKEPMSVGYVILSAVGILASIVMAMVELWLIASIALSIAALTLIAGWFTRRPTVGGATTINNIAYGKGPHRRYTCQADKAMADRFYHLVCDLRDAAAENQWHGAYATIEKLLPDVELELKANHAISSIRQLANITIEAMKQIRLNRSN